MKQLLLCLSIPTMIIILLSCKGNRNDKKENIKIENEHFQME